MLKKLTLLLWIFSIGLFLGSCGGDKGGGGSNYAKVSDVNVSLKVNNLQQYTLTDRSTTLEYVAEVSFPSKPINWTSPAIRLSYNSVLSVSNSNVRVIDNTGATVSSATASVGNGQVVATFSKVNDGFDYLRSKTFRMVVEAQISSSVTDSQLGAIGTTGFDCSSSFGNQNQYATPVKATVFPLLEDVDPMNGVSLTMTVNGEEGYTMTDRGDKVFYSTQLNTGTGVGSWTTPTFEQTFDEALFIDKVIVRYPGGLAFQYSWVNINNNKVTITFDKRFGNYDYILDRPLVVDVRTSIKPDVSYEELDQFKSTGFVSEAKFYATDPAEAIQSNPVEVLTNIAPYSEVGDTQEYPYNLNVVYFVPSDITPNPESIRRISTLLKNFQLFICEWMDYWGYGYRSFGLPLRSNGMVDVVTVFGSEPKSGYPYEPSNVTIPKTQNEINEYYRRNNLARHSDHTLVIFAVNDINDTGVPFYGYGRWCFALDYPGMSQEEFPGNSSSLLGGLMHELGHGLNLPHVGPSYSQRRDDSFGITLMGAGNMTYGKTPTFFHEASAATLNVSQVAALTEGTFYDDSQSQVFQPEVVINGGECTVRGTFTSQKTVQDVIVRFYNSTETFLGGSAGYTSVAFVAKATPEKTYEVTLPISDLREIPSTTYKLGITILNSNGSPMSYSNQNNIYTLVNQGGGNYTLTESTASGAGVNVVTENPYPMYVPGKRYGTIIVPVLTKIWPNIGLQ